MSTIEGDKILLYKLFDEFWFNIPEYQRPYVWDEEQIDELLEDLWFAFKNKREDEYFLGSLILYRKKESAYMDFNVLDGQQRLTSLLLMLAVIRDLLEKPKKSNSCGQFIYQKEDSFRRRPSRVKLIYKIREDVQDFINEFIKNKDSTKEVSKLKEISKKKNITIANMAKNILLFKKFFEKNKEDLEIFANYLFNRVVFMYVSTNEFEDSYRLFTILNNRGIPLRNSDILKSENIGVIKDLKEKEKYAKKWEDLENSFKEDEFNRFLSFIRTIFAKTKARENLLNEYKKLYEEKLLIKGKDTIDLLIKYRGYYDKLLEFIDFDLGNDYKNLITIMKFSLYSTDWIPPLLFYYHKFKDKKLLEFLKKLEFKFTGDWILRESPTKRLNNMNSIIKRIEKIKSNEPNEILSEDDLFYIDLDELEDTLMKKIYGKRFTRFLLLKLEYLLTDSSVVHISNHKYISVEHVLPQNPKMDSKWYDEFTADEMEYWTHKLGNLILISKRKNSKLSNLDFLEKKNRYLKSRIEIFPSHKIFLERNEWNIEILKERQEKLLKLFIYNGEKK